VKPVSPCAPSAPPVAGPRGGLRILVADDNVDSAKSLAILLEIMGNEVHTAHDGCEAVDTATTFHPDLALLDIGMPRLNGYEACRRIREQPWGKTTVMVALTGWGQIEDVRRSEQAGFDHHLVKPVEPGVLEKLLASLQSRSAS
jgi:CheY-like chemotaxis protein